MRPDGLYHVTNAHMSAAFAIEGGRVTWCAPILRRRIDYWMRRAVLISSPAGK